MNSHLPSDLSDQLSTLLIEVIAASLEAGRAILEIYREDIEVEYKADKSPLTAADRASHDILSQHLKSASLKVPILSEEGRDIPYAKRQQWDTFWLVDPLDGTKEFIKRNGEFTVNVALIKEGAPYLGIIYVPVTDTLYFGARGMGSWKLIAASKKPAFVSVAALMTASKRLPIKTHAGPLTVIGSRSHVSDTFKSFMETMKRRHDKIELVPAGSSLKFGLVAEGRADIYPRYGPTMEWDTAAGQAVVEQAGGRVLDADRQRPLQYNKENLLNPWFIVCRKDFSLGEVLK